MKATHYARKGFAILISLLVLLGMLPGVAFASPDAVVSQQEGNTFEDRAAALITYFSQNSPWDHRYDNANWYKNFSKYHSWIAEAAFEVGDIERGRTLATEAINRASDMFHFYALMDCYKRYGQYYTSNMVTSLKSKMNRSYNLSSGTENHKLMNATAAYMAGQEWPDIQGTVGYTAARDWLDAWMNRITKQGFLEQDSSTYMAMYVSAMIVLTDHATDPVMRNKARMSLEWIMAQWAPEWMNGYHVTSSYRMFNPEFEPKYTTESHIIGWLYFGGEQPAEFMKYLPDWDEWYATGSWAIPLAVSSYRLPDIIVRIAQDRTVPVVHRETCDVGGYNPTGFHRYTYINGDYGLSSTYNGYNWFFRDQIHEGQIKWVTSEPNSTFYINQPVKDYSNDVVYGQLMVRGATPTFQTLQHEGTQISVHRMDSGGMNYLRAPVSKTALVSKIEDGKWLFMDAGPVYIGVYIHGGYTYFYEDSRYRWIKSTTSTNAVVIETAPKADFPSLSAFQSAVKALPLTVSSGNSVRFTNLKGHQMEINWQGSRSVDGVAYNYSTWPLIDNNWMHQDRGGRYLHIEHASEACTYDFDNWTVNCSTNTPTNTPTPTPVLLTNTPTRTPTNTPYVTPTPYGLPDLIVVNISSNPACPGIGADVQLCATIKNQGTNWTPDGVIHGVKFQVDGTTRSWSDTYKSAMAPGEEVTVCANSGPDGDAYWNSAPEGTHTVLAWVDDYGPNPYKRIEESNENNNTLEKAFPIPCTGVTPTPVPPTNTPTPTPVPPTNTPTRTPTPTPVPPTNTPTRTPTPTPVPPTNTPTRTPTPTPVPPTNTPYVTPTPYGLPDLIVVNISSNPACPGIGANVQLCATIKNQGTNWTPEGVIHGVKFQVDGTTRSWSDTYKSAIAPGEEVTVCANNGPDGDAYWNSAPEGTHTVLAWVDDYGPNPYKRIEESNENNNTLEKAFPIPCTG